MVKETANSLIINKFKIPEEKLKDVKVRRGKNNRDRKRQSRSI